MNHSIAQLHLLHEAASRRDAAAGLRMLQVMTVATGNAKQGAWDDVRKALSKQAGIA